MIKSLSEFKYFKSFRLPIEAKDDIHFNVEVDDPFSTRGEAITDAKLLDVSITGLGFKSSSHIPLGESLSIAISYKRLRFDVTANVVRVISGRADDPHLIYGLEIDESDDREKMSRFVAQLINYFSLERLKDAVKNLALAEHYADMDEGFEMFSLLLSLFKDITEFGKKEGFIDSMLVEVCRLMNAQKAMVFLINTETNQLETCSTYGVDQKVLKFDYRKGVAGSVFTTGSSLNIDRNHEKIHSFKAFDEIVGSQTESVICSPIANREDKVIGVLQIINKRNESRFTQDDERTMKVLSLIFSTFYSMYNPISEKSMVRRFSAPHAREIIYIGKHESTTNLRKSIFKLKDEAAPLLIRGEMGVGKSLYAHILHAEGMRGLKEYCELRSKGRSEEELINELFGSDEVGLIERCNGGTLCLEEVWQMPLSVQRKIASVIEKGYLNEGEVAMKLDVRFIFTSSMDLDQAVEQGLIDVDLADKMGVFQVQICPLRERKRDIGELIDFYLAKECKEQGFLLKVLSDDIKQAFLDYEWPKNVRELKTAISRLVKYNPKNHVITEVDDLTLPILNAPVKAHLSSDLPYVNDFSIELKDRVCLVEREMILAEIKRHKGNKSKAAKTMGISREALRKKLLQSDEIHQKLQAKEQVKDLAGASQKKAA